jgi:adenosylcobinamide kinase/adenosylcobinamide-phosphate guanylyltransferase
VDGVGTGRRMAAPAARPVRMKAGLMLVLGGARSGKSAYAERMVEASGLTPIYVATAQAGDAEMSERIATHRKRRGTKWRTIEAPDDLEGMFRCEAGEGRAILIDCLTLWLSNIMHAGANIEARTQALCATAQGARGLVVLVSNEVGLGLVPETPLGRAFRDAQGRLNQAVAEIADRVVFMAAGLPLILKGAAT